MLRISIVESSHERVTLLLEGRVTAGEVVEIERSSEEALASRRRLELDLSGVLFVDREGTRLFQRLHDRHVVIAGCSRFVAEQIHTEALEKEETQ